MSEKIKSILIKAIVQIIFIIFSITIVFAFYYLIVNSLKTEQEFAKSQFFLPGSLNFNNIINVWKNGGIDIAVKNSFILGISTVMLTLLFGSLAAYAFAFLRFRLKKFLYLTIISTMYFSPMILVLPLFLQFIDMGLNNTYIGAIAIHTALRLAFSIFLLTTFFRGIPIEVIEAATIDGSSRLRILKNIILPLSTPALLSLMLLNFYGVWNDLLIGVLFLQKPELKPVMVAISLFRSKDFSSVTNIFAASLIATIPILIIYGITQKFFVKGMTLGSIK